MTQARCASGPTSVDITVRFRASRPTPRRLVDRLPLRVRNEADREEVSWELSLKVIRPCPWNLSLP